MNATTSSMETFVDEVMTLVDASGLTWEEAVTALGMASKTLAMQASDDGNDPEHACLEQATKYLVKGLKHGAAPQFYTLH